MERKSAHAFDQELLILFDAYVHGALDRRGFLDKAAKYSVGGVTAAMLLDQLSPRFAEAQVVKPDDGRINAQYVEYASPNGSGTMRGYLVQPTKAAGKLPAVCGPREPRIESPHRGHRAPPRARRLRRVRPGRALPAGRIPGRGATSGSMPADPRTRPRSRRRTSATSATSTPARSTGSTTTRLRATTPPPPSSPGSGRSRSSTSNCERARELGSGEDEKDSEDRSPDGRPVGNGNLRLRCRLAVDLRAGEGQHFQ